MALLAEMRLHSLDPTLVTINAAITACRRIGRLDLAKDFFDSVHEFHLQPDVMVYTAMITACEPSKAWRLALSLLSAMRPRALHPDALAYNAFIGVCRDAAKWDWALAALAELEGRSLEATSATYKASIGAVLHGQQWERALHLFGEFRLRAARGCSAVSSSSAPELLLQDLALQGGAVAKACHEASQWALAAQLLREAKQHIVAPLGEWLSVLHWEAALSEFAGLRQRGAWPDWPSCCGFIAALLETDRDLEALTVYREAHEAGIVNAWDASELGVLDLHRLGCCSADVAMLAVCEAVLQLSHDGRPTSDLVIITGRGSRSRDASPVLLPAVKALLIEELKLDASEVPRNPGRLLVTAASMRQLWAPRLERNEAARL